jgi:hypothetical protein
LLEELIAAEADPRNLLVVSSDHRVQRAARQRGAGYVDSEMWHAQLAAASRSQADPSPATPTGRESEKDQVSLTNPFPPGYASELLDDLNDGRFE